MLFVVAVVANRRTFGHRVDVPNSERSLAAILTERDLQSEQGDAHEDKTDHVGDQEGPCNINHADQTHYRSNQTDDVAFR